MVVYDDAGICPKCGSDNLDFDPELRPVDDGETISFPYVCMECKFVGYEVHLLSFIGHKERKENKS